MSSIQSEPPRFDIELDPSDLEQSGPRLVCLVKPEWINEKVSFTKMSEGLSNKMVAMYPHSKDEQGLIVRTYGINSDLIVDRECEIRTMVRLSEHNLSSKVLLTFKNGIIYTVVPGEQIDINDEKIDQLVAKKLAEYHSIPSDNTNRKQKSKIVEKFRHYVNLLNGKNCELRERLESKSPSKSIIGTIKTTVGLQSSPPSLDSLESFLDYSWSQLDDDLHQIEQTLDRHWSNVPVVFCHNDTLSGNFLHDKQTNTLHIVDFEHGFHNIYLFDIENYFVEFAGLNSSPQWEEKYPSRERRKAFLAQYLKYAQFPSDQKSEDELEKLCDRSHRLISLTHLYWALWSLLQSLLNPEALREFDYVNYAKNRFNQYKLRKHEFLSS